MFICIRTLFSDKKLSTNHYYANRGFSLHETRHLFEDRVGIFMQYLFGTLRILNHDSIPVTEGANILKSTEATHEI